MVLVGYCVEQNEGIYSRGSGVSFASDIIVLQQPITSMKIHPIWTTGFPIITTARLNSSQIIPHEL